MTVDIHSDAAARPAGAERRPWSPPLSDATAWLVAALALVPLLRALGGPLGEPVSDDFDYLARARFGAFDFFDGGGAVVHWRPLARQVYYAAVAPLLVSQPWIVGVLQGAVLAFACVLLYRALERPFGRRLALAAATFPALMEPARMVVAWPSVMQDLGALLFSALALYLASRGRLLPSLLALLAGLWCKESAIVAAVVLPWMPAESGPAPRTRRRFALSTLGLCVAWGVAWLAVTKRAGLVLLRDLDPAVIITPWTERAWWAARRAAADAFGLGVLPRAIDVAILAALAAIAVIAVVAFARRPAARKRLRSVAPWAVWGLAWFALCVALFAEVYPGWADYRTPFAAVGLGVALVAVLGAARPALPMALLAVRLAALAIAPAPSSGFAHAPASPDLDYAELTRLQRVAEHTRLALRARVPTLPAGAAVGQHHRPLMTEHALGGSKALRVWYGDSTLRWVPWEELPAVGSADVAAVVEYEPGERVPIAFVEPAALAAYFVASERLRTGDLERALEGFQHAEQLQTDRGARVFLGAVAGKRALALLGQVPLDEVERVALTALGRWRESGDARYVLATVLAAEGRKAEARAHIDTLLALYPDDASARELIQSIEEPGGEPGF